MTKHLVTYTGPTQHTRILTKKDQETIGAKASSIKGDLQWDALHGHTLVVEDIDDTLRLYLENSANFKVTEQEQEVEPEIEAEASEVPLVESAKEKAAGEKTLEEANDETVPSEGDASGSAATAATVGTPSARSTKTSSR